MNDNATGRAGLRWPFLATGALFVLTGAFLVLRRDGGSSRSETLALNHLLRLARTDARLSDPDEEALRKTVRDGKRVRELRVDDYLLGSGVRDVIVSFEGSKPVFELRFRDEEPTPTSSPSTRGASEAAH